MLSPKFHHRLHKLSQPFFYDLKHPTNSSDVLRYCFDLNCIKMLPFQPVFHFGEQEKSQGGEFRRVGRQGYYNFILKLKEMFVVMRRANKSDKMHQLICILVRRCHKHHGLFAFGLPGQQFLRLFVLYALCCQQAFVRPCNICTKTFCFGFV